MFKLKKMKKLQLLITAVLVGMTMLACSEDNNNNNDSDLTCEDATAQTAVAADAYADATPANYNEKCVAYKAALEAQIVACGDASGALQLMIDGLGDCSVASLTGSITVTAGSSPRNFNSNITITTVGATRHIYAEEATTGYYIEFDLAPGVTGADVLMNFNIHLISSDYNPLPDDEGGNWTSNITVNTATEINGTFYGYVTSPTTGADLDLTSGVINIDL